MLTCEPDVALSISRSVSVIIRQATRCDRCDSVVSKVEEQVTRLMLARGTSPSYTHHCYHHDA